MEWLLKAIDSSGLYRRTKLIYRFTLYIAILSLFEGLLIEMGMDFLYAKNIAAFYAEMSFSLVIGFLMFALSRKVIKGKKTRAALMSFCQVGWGCCILAIFIDPLNERLFFLGTVSLFFWGYLGGSMYYYLAMQLEGGQYTGRVLGISLALASIIQMAAQMLVLVPIFLGICSVLITWELWRVIYRPVVDSAHFEDPLPYGEVHFIRKDIEILLIAVVIVMTIILSMNGFVLVGFWMERSDNQIYLLGDTRVYLLIGLLLAGFLADYQRRRHMSLVMMSMMFFSVIGCVLFAYESYPYVYQAILEFYTGFYMVFTTIVFMDLAPKTDLPELWAGMGRVLRSLFGGLIALPLDRFSGIVETHQLLVLNIAFLAVLVGLLLKRNRLILKMEQEKAMRKSEDKIYDFSQKYKLTPREREVFAKIMESDKSLRELAVELFLSERVLQRYLTNIYNKAGAKSRISLCMLFYDDKNSEN